MSCGDSYSASSKGTRDIGRRSRASAKVQPSAHHLLDASYKRQLQVIRSDVARSQGAAKTGGMGEIMHKRSQRRGLRAALTIVGVLVLAFGLYSGLVIIGSATTNTCQQEGPSSALALVSENSDVVQQGLSWWPLGRACEWARADGNGTVTTYSGSPAGTASVYGAILVGAGLLTRGLWRSTHNETRGRAVGLDPAQHSA